jgi:hypothetical protein
MLCLVLSLGLFNLSVVEKLGEVVVTHHHLSNHHDAHKRVFLISLGFLE